MNRNRFRFGALAGFLAAAAWAGEVTPLDLDAAFGRFDGCFVLLDAAGGHRFEYKPARLDERLSPCSTFKIPNSLIGLECGVLSGPEHEFTWDGVRGSRPEVNRDHTLRTAIRDSVVWYYQRVASEVGAPRMQTWLDKLNYGNRDMSAGLTEFWLHRSLTISANEQVALLDQLRQGRLPASARSQQIVADILTLASDERSVYRAKSGSGANGDRAVLGWWVGWVASDGRDYVFACNIKAESGANGYKAARDIVERILADFERGRFGEIGLRMPVVSDAAPAATQPSP